METNQNGAGRKKLYISVIVALLLVNSVSLYFLFSENHEKTDVIIEKTALQNNFKSLSDSLDAKNTVIDQYIGKDAALDKAIAEKEDMLTQEKHEIAGLLHKNKMTGAELAKAKGLMVEYQASISDLQAKVDALMAENQQLKGQNQQLAADLSTEKQTTTQLSVKNEGLSKKVEVGSLLSVADLSVEAIKTRNNGKEVQVKKAKAAQQFKISFETGENKVIDPGQLSLYVRIINPKGETIAVADQGSGTMQCENSDQPCQFTKKADIDYNQTNKKVVLYWGQDIKDPGTYKIELYQNGHVIGQSAVTLS
jgi:regulator of replication initiation timing